MEMTHVDSPDEETTKMIERMAVLRLSTKHINLWTRHLEMKMNGMCVGRVDEPGWNQERGKSGGES